MSKTTHPHIEGSSPQEEPYYLSCKRIDPKPIIEYGYVSYACDNSGFLRHLKGRDDEGMLALHGQGPHYRPPQARQRTTCPHSRRAIRRKENHPFGVTIKS